MFFLPPMSHQSPMDQLYCQQNSRHLTTPTHTVVIQFNSVCSFRFSLKIFFPSSFGSLLFFYSFSLTEAVSIYHFYIGEYSTSSLGPGTVSTFGEKNAPVTCRNRKLRSSSPPLGLPVNLIPFKDFDPKRLASKSRDVKLLAGPMDLCKG